MVSAQIVSVGAGLSSTSPITLQPDGSLSLDTVTSAASSADPNADQLVLRVTVKNGGTAAGQGVLKTVVTADDPNTPGGQWTDEVDSVLALTAPDVAPSISGAMSGQNATNTMLVHPFAEVRVTDPDPGQTETVTIQLSDKLLGTLSGTQGTWNALTGSYSVSGTVDVVQAAVQGLVFTSGTGRSGLEQFSMTVNDGAGGVAQDSTTTLNVSPASPDAAGIQHFALSPTATVLTSTASGDRTVAQIETYHGPVDYLQSQFIYDGTQPLAIVARTPNTFIKSVAGAAAVQLLSGQNVVDAGHGSNFLLGGTGQDVFYLDGRQAAETWDTIVGFNSGDIATLWGYTDGVSHYWWDDNAGAPGYTGRTLRADLTGSGHVEASITFAGKTGADTGNYAITTGTIGGNDYMTIFAR